jgi:hypothetical protein
VEQVRARDDTMSGNDRFVSPYLLRPLRTLDQVLGGRGRALEPEPERVESRETAKKARARRWIENTDSSRSRQPAERPQSDLHP